MEIVLAVDVREAEVDFDFSEFRRNSAKAGRVELDLHVGGDVDEIDPQQVLYRDPEQIVRDERRSLPVLNQWQCQLDK